MNQGKYVFAQICSFLDHNEFNSCTNRYNGNRWVKHFSCWNQMLCMMFGQLSARESLRDLLVSISAHKSKYYHLGFGRNVSRSNLASANEQRDYRIFEDYAYTLISQARRCCINDADFKLALDGNVYAFDSTIIDLCLSVFWWAKFRKNKGAVKMHTLFDVKTSIPSFIHITDGLTHDVHGLDQLNFEPGGFYILDRGYLDFDRLYKIHKNLSYFVTRAKNNTQLKRLYSINPNKEAGVLSDQIVKLSTFYSLKSYPEKLRRIRYFDKENNRTFVFLTNNQELNAEEIALLYKYRWKIELFFKWIKQHLKIKSFWGTSENAVKTQIFIAIITYCVVSIMKSKLKIQRSTYEILQILSVSLFDKTPINELFTNRFSQYVKERNHIQLNFNLI